MKPVAEQRGGESVLLRRVVSRDKQAMIARRLRGTGKRPEIAEPTIARHNATEGPLSFGQQRFWFLDQLEPGEPVYHVCFGFNLTGPINFSAAEAALAQIIRRHESLRTAFANRDGAPVQVILPPPTITIPVVDLEPIEGDPDQLRRHFEAEAARPFNLTADLALRAKLFRLSAGKHVLFFVMHHIATDAWSIRLLFEEWTEFYDAAVAGKTAEFPELPIQYSDFARWQRENMEGETLKEELAYWKRKLAGVPVLQLPTEHPRPAIPSNLGGTRSVIVDRELSTALSRLATEEGASKFMVLMAAFKVLLQRYSGQDDIVVGSPISRRTQQQTEALIGLFLNTSVLRTDLSGNPTFREALQRIRATSLEAYAHQQIPFEKIVEELQPARDASRTPLFQVMFTLQDGPPPRKGLAGSGHAELFEFDLAVAPFDLTLLIQENEKGTSATLEYKADLFSPQSIDRMLGHFRRLLEGIVQNPESRVSELPILTSAERRQLLTEFNPPATAYPREKSVHGLFEEQAARTPAAPAIKFGSHTLSYRELNERANQLAHHLKAVGVGIETPVGIFLERSPEMIIGVLAALKAGGAYVPFEPDEPAERLAFKLRDSGIDVLLTQQSLLGALPDSLRNVPSSPKSGHNHSKSTIVCLDRDHASISRHVRENPNHPNSGKPDHLAYIIYTSGSTGQPKGVLVEHHSVVNHSICLARQFELRATDRVLQFAPLSFDVSAEEIFATLLHGGLLVLRPAGLAVSVQDFHPFVLNEQLTVLNLPTPYWNEWMSVMEANGLELPPSLRLIIAGSDTVTGEHYERWLKLTGGRVRWCNAYGTTEATITSTIFDPRPDERPSCVPIGRPTINTQVYILDQHQHLTPIGFPGEIYIGGEEVARGYLNRPEATAANFVPDIFSGRAGALLNRTGDFARWRADGNIEFMGRRDKQVKIRGFRIEPGEVESALLQHPEITEAAVLPRIDPRGEKCLVAYFVAADAAQLAGKLRDFLKERLPSYMLPAAFVPLAQLPRLSSGKLDSAALPDHGAERPHLEEAFVAPSDSLEEKLVRIWRHVLGLKRIGVNDNFFDLGGHSLLAVRLFAEIDKLTGWNVPMLALFQSPTIKQLAQVIRRTQSTATRSSILPVQAQGTRPPFFLVHGAGGGMLWGYANLAKYMGADQPVYAFNSRGMDGLEEFSSVEEIAVHYVQDLRAFQPQGPYYLGGYCFGGEVAFEMAQQLVAHGEHVAFLALINSMPSHSAFYNPSFSPLWASRFVRNSWHWLHYFANWTPQRRRNFIQRKFRSCIKRLRGRFDRDNSGQTYAEDAIDLSPYSEAQRRLWDVHLRAADNYRHRQYPGSVVVFRTRFHPFFCSFDPTYGWSEFVRGDIAVRLVPGNHESILAEPHVRAIAAELNDCLGGSQMIGQRAGGELPGRDRRVEVAVRQT